MLKECRVVDDVSPETLAEIRAHAKLAADHEAAGSFAEAAEAQLDLARLHRFTGDVTAADVAYQRSAELVVKETHATATDGATVDRGGPAVAGAESGKTTDGSEGLVGRAKYIHNLTHRGASC